MRVYRYVSAFPKPPEIEEIVDLSCPSLRSVLNGRLIALLGSVLYRLLALSKTAVSETDQLKLRQQTYTICCTVCLMISQSSNKVNGTFSRTQ